MPGPMQCSVILGVNTLETLKLIWPKPRHHERECAAVRTVGESESASPRRDTATMLRDNSTSVSR